MDNRVLWLFGEPGCGMVDVAFPMVEGASLTPEQQNEGERIRRLFPEGGGVSS